MTLARYINTGYISYIIIEVFKEWVKNIRIELNISEKIKYATTKGDYNTLQTRSILL